jgi:hypothetical protein
MYPFHNKASLYGEDLLATRSTPNLRDHPLSALRDCLFNIFAATLHTVGRSSIRKLGAHHLLTGICLLWANNNNSGNNNNNHQTATIYWLGWKIW